MNNHMLYTIGHSNRTIEELITCLEEHRISALADVRSTPFSAKNPQFNRDAIRESLMDHGIAYVFLGTELGARRDEESCYFDGVAIYERIAETNSFQSGIDRIRSGMKSHQIALMCAEKDPLTCHRTILVCRHLKQDTPITHIIGPGLAETNEAMEDRLLRSFDLLDRNLFESREELLCEAYQKQGWKIAYRTPTALANNQTDE